MKYSHSIGGFVQELNDQYVLGLWLTDTMIVHFLMFVHDCFRAVGFATLVRVALKKDRNQL